MHRLLTKHMLFFSCCALLCLVLFAGIAQATEPHLSPEELRYIDSNTVLMIYDPAWPPFDYRDQDGNHAGIIADFLKLIAQKTGLQMAAIHTNNWPESVQLMQQGRFDIVSLLNQSEERSKYLKFTGPVLTGPLTIVARSESEGAINLPTFEGSVAVVDGYIYAEQVLGVNPQAHLVIGENTEATLRMVNDGEADITVITEVEAKHLIRKNGWSDLKVVGEAPFGNDLRIGIRKDNPVLLGIMKKGLESITESERTMLLGKWVADPKDINEAPPFQWQFLAISVVALLLAFIVYRKTVTPGST